MPVAHCFVHSLNGIDAEEIAQSWASHAPFAASEMSVLLSNVASTGGKQYAVIATLFLPSLWSSEKRDALQTGLALAIGQVTELPQGEIFVVTQRIESEHVVENGQVQRW